VTRKCLLRLGTNTKFFLNELESIVMYVCVSVKCIDMLHTVHSL